MWVHTSNSSSHEHPRAARWSPWSIPLSRLLRHETSGIRLGTLPRAGTYPGAGFPVARTAIRVVPEGVSNVSNSPSSEFGKEVTFSCSRSDIPSLFPSPSLGARSSSSSGTPSPSGPGITTSGSTASTKFLVVEAPTLSATSIVKLKTPSMVGVPVSKPPTLNITPGGNIPPVTVQPYGEVPPVAEKVSA